MLFSIFPSFFTGQQIFDKPLTGPRQSLAQYQSAYQPRYQTPFHFSCKAGTSRCGRAYLRRSSQTFPSAVLLTTVRLPRPSPHISQQTAPALPLESGDFGGGGGNALKRLLQQSQTWGGKTSPVLKWFNST